MVSRSDLLKVLPPFTNSSLLIEGNQNVPDIIREVLDAHKYFANDYDCIYAYFDKGNIDAICKSLFDFCKKNIQYKIEGENEQTTKSPSALLAVAYGDCKHYAGFIAGVLSAIQRNTGKKINWCYRFASYDLFVKEPGHVFVVVKDSVGEIWIDPVLNSYDERLIPSYITDKKVSMPLYRLSGVDQLGYLLPETMANQLDSGELVYTTIPQSYPDPTEFTVIPEGDIVPDISSQLDEEDSNLSPEILQAIELLLYYDVLNSEGGINDDLLLNYSNTLPGDIYEKIVSARVLLNTASVNGFFSTVWRGVKKVSMAVPRGAYLSLVALNVFGLGSKLKQATSTEDGANKIRNVWYKLGGDWAKLRQAIDNGAKRKRIMGVGAAAAALPAWVLAASAIIAALAPIITSVLKQQQSAGMNIDPMLLNNTGMPTTTTSGSAMDWIKENPLIVAGGAGLAIWYFTSNGRVSGPNTKRNAAKIILPLGVAAGLFFMLRKKEEEVVTVPEITEGEVVTPLPKFPDTPTTTVPTSPVIDPIAIKYPDRSLIKTDTSDRVYVMDGGQRHWIINNDVFNAYGFRWEDIQRIPSYEMATIPEGAALT